MAPITETFVANIHHFIAARGLDLLSFGKGEDKDAIGTGTWRFPRHGRGAVRRPRPGEGVGVPQPEAPQPADGQEYPCG